MDYPIYLMSLEPSEPSWAGVVSLQGKHLHFELSARGGEGGPAAAIFRVPVEQVRGVEFLRGLFSRRIGLQFAGDANLERFPAGVVGKEVHLMIEKAHPEADGPRMREADYENLVGEIRSLAAVEVAPAADGLVS